MHEPQSPVLKSQKSSGPGPDGPFTNRHILPLFVTPLWVFELAPEIASRINAGLEERIEAALTPRPPIKPGETWQTDQNLHLMPEFAELDRHIRRAAHFVFDEVLALVYEDFLITGCWANINPVGAAHKEHQHPNNFLSGVYYVKAGEGGNRIEFADPRPQAHFLMPQVKLNNGYNSGKTMITIQPGVIVLFPSWLRHSVPANHSQEERISIAFNLMFTDFTETISLPKWKGRVPLGESAE